MTKFKTIIICALLTILSIAGMAQTQTVKPLHVEGRYFKDDDGKIVNLHGFAQTYSPWFNEMGTKWTNYDVQSCLIYNKGIIDRILDAGWKMDFVRLHMDPYWSNTPGISTTGENDISAFSMERFKKYLREVFIPMAKYAQSKGMYVIMRPPGVCPENLQLGDAYQKYLLKVWGYVAQQAELKDNPAIMYELANEPVHFTSTTGNASMDLHNYFQAITDTIRHHCNNIVLVPGTGWQSQYGAYAQYPIEGGNIGYAVHCYPGWYNSGVEGNVSVNYKDFRRGWRSQIGCVSSFAPVVVTEMDWGPESYGKSWGKAVTGTAGGTGFGANFKKITDDDGNISWLLFTSPDILADWGVTTSPNYAFLTDPEACPWPCYHWYQEYAVMEWEEKDVNASSEMFPLTDDDFDPSIFANGTFDETTGTLHTGQWGFGGWYYPVPIDLSDYQYLVAELWEPQSCGASFRIFDEDSYWSTPFMADFGGSTTVVVDLHNMMKNGTTTACDPSHIYRVGFWTTGSGSIRIRRVFVSNDGESPVSSITNIPLPSTNHPTPNTNHPSPIFSLAGTKVASDASQLPQLPRGIYIIGGKKVIK